MLRKDQKTAVIEGKVKKRSPMEWGFSATERKALHVEDQCRHGLL